MAYIPASNVLQVELRGTQFLKELENTLYFQHTGAIAPSDVTALFGWLETIFMAALQPLMSDDAAFDEIYGTDLTTSISPTYSQVLSPAIAGVRTSPPLPNSNTCCVSFRTNGRGRGARGRNYTIGLTEDAVNDDAVTVGIANGLVAAYELILGGGTFPSGWTWVVLSRFLDGLPRLLGLAQTITDVLVTDLEVDSQRKRVK